MESRKRTCLGTGGIILAGLFIYWPALQGKFLWDDHVELVQNPELARMDGWWRIWLRPEDPDYFPLKTTLQWCEWHLWGSRVLPYHLVSLGLHLLGALLLWRLLSRLQVTGSYLAGLLFAVHPLCVESVAWISELKNVLSLPLLLLAMLFYLRWSGLTPGRCATFSKPVERADLSALNRRQAAASQARWGQRAPPYVFSVLCFILAMLSKSSVVMFPVVLLLYAWWRRGRVGWPDVKASLPFFAVSAILGVVTVWFQSTRAIGGVALHLGGPLWRLGQAALAVAFYLYKCLLPVELMPIYPDWSAAAPHLAPALCLIVLLAAAVVLRRWWRAGNRGALFGAGFFLINLAPVLGFIPMSYLRISRVADHFCYLPLLGIVALGAAGARKRLPGPAVAALCALLALLSREQAAIYRSETSFWSLAVERNPGSWLAQNSFAMDLVSQGRPAEALTHFHAALRLKPDYAEAENDWGDALLRLNRLPEAIEHFQRAIRLKPDYAEAYCNWGGALVQSGRYAEAIARFEQAMRMKPGYASAYNNRGLVYSSEGRQKEAIADFETALRFNPGMAEAELDLGLAYARSGRLPVAIEHYHRALRLRPDFREAHNDLANALYFSGRTREAVAEYETALRIDPHYVDARNNLAIARKALESSHDRP